MENRERMMARVHKLAMAMCEEAAGTALVPEDGVLSARELMLLAACDARLVAAISRAIPHLRPVLATPAPATTRVSGSRVSLGRPGAVAGWEACLSAKLVDGRAGAIP